VIGIHHKHSVRPIMSVSLSASECSKYSMDNKPWGGSYSESEYSTSIYSNISSSPMDCSSKLDETSSLCSSNSSTTTDVIRLPKPPPSLGRRKQRKLSEQTAEVFEFSDLVLETLPLKPEIKSNGSVNIGFVDNGALEESQTIKDRYEALRNIDINDNDSFTFQKSENINVEPTNPFLPVNCRNFNSEPTTQCDIYQKGDKYAAISQAIAISEQPEGGSGVSGSLKWSQSVPGEGKYGWSDQVLSGCDTC